MVKTIGYYLFVVRKCPKCNGKLKLDYFYDYTEDSVFVSKRFKCEACGWIEPLYWRHNEKLQRYLTIDEVLTSDNKDGSLKVLEEYYYAKGKT